MNMQNSGRAILFLIFSVTHTPYVRAALLPGIYFSESERPGASNDPNAIKRASFDGSQQVTIATAFSSFGIESSTGAGRIFWTDSGGDTVPKPNLIASADSSGMDRHDLVTTGLSFPFEISIDDAARKMYWTNSLSGNLERANLDGSSRELVHHVSDDFSGLLRAVHVDSRSGDVYFGRQGGDLFKLASDATSPTVIVSNASPFGLDIDPIENRIFWTNVEQDKIQSSLLDGSDVQDIVTGGITTLGGLSIDVKARKLYWTDQSRRTINRVNLDGTEREIVISLLHLPFAVEVVSVPEPTMLQILTILVAMCSVGGQHRNSGVCGQSKNG